MKSKVLSAVLLFLLVSSILSHAYKSAFYSSDLALANTSGMELQTKKKPPQDYMKKLTSRNPKSLGLKENKELTKLLDQPHIKWVIRSEHKHVLN